MADKSMRLNMILSMVDKITSPISKVTSTTGKMAGKIEKSQKALQKLGSMTKDIEHFRKLKTGSAETGAALDKAKTKVKNLAVQMASSGKVTAKMRGEFDRATGAVRKLKTQTTNEAQELQKLKTKLNEAGVSTRKLNDATRKIKDQSREYTEQLAKQKSALNKVAVQQKNISRIKARNQDMRSGAMVDTVGVAAAVYGIQKLVGAYGDIATAQGEIRSLGIGDKGIDQITAQAKAYSEMWAGTGQAEFIRASYDIKSGISSLSDTAVAEFTKIAALTAGATKSSTGLMTSLFASGYGIYRKQFTKFGEGVIEGWENLSDAERDMKFGEYFSAGIASSVQAFKTDGQQMSAAISNLGASATAANVSFAEQLSVLGMLQQTMTGSEAATKYKAFLMGAAKASDDLGLSFMDANNQLKSMPEVLQELKKKYGDTIDAVEEKELKKAFGTSEALGLIQLLYPEIDKLKGSIGGMNDSLAGGMTVTERMARAILEGPTEALDRMGNRLVNASATIGQVFAPAMMDSADAVGSAAMKISELVQQFPMLFQGIAYAIGGLIAFKIASIAGRLAFSTLSDMLNLGRKAFMLMTTANLRTNAVLVLTKMRAKATGAAMLVMSGIQKTITASSGLMTAATWALNTAMSANPIGLVIIAITALVAAVVLIYKNWEPLAQFFSNMWGKIQNAFSVSWDYIKGLFDWLPLGTLSAAWDPLSGFFSGLWDGIKAVFNLHVDAIKALLGFNPITIITENWGNLGGYFSNLWNGITNSCTQAMKELLSSVLGPLNSIQDSVTGVWDSVFGDDDKKVEISKTVKQVSDKVPAAMRGTRAETVKAAQQSAVRPVAAVGAAAFAPRPVSNSVTISHGDINIHASPGMSVEDVGRELRRLLNIRDQETARKTRGMLLDS